MVKTSQQKIPEIISNIRSDNNITYEQMATILSKAGYPVQSTSLRRLAVGKAQTIPVYLANGLIKCFGLSVSTSEILYACGYEFVLDDQLQDHERELILALRQVPEDAQIGIVQSMKMGLVTMQNMVAKFLKENVLK